MHGASFSIFLLVAAFWNCLFFLRLVIFIDVLDTHEKNNLRARKILSSKLQKRISFSYARCLGIFNSETVMIPSLASTPKRLFCGTPPQSQRASKGLLLLFALKLQSLSLSPVILKQELSQPVNCPFQNKQKPQGKGLQNVGFTSLPVTLPYILAQQVSAISLVFWYF